MISKREKLQYVCTFVTDILSLALSIALGWLVVDGLLGKVGNYTASDLIQAFCLLMLAYLLTFLTFDQSDYGPDPAPLMAEIARRGWSPTIICESAGTQAEDALEMKKLYQAAQRG